MDKHTHLQTADDLVAAYNHELKQLQRLGKQRDLSVLEPEPTLAVNPEPVNEDTSIETLEKHFLAQFQNYKQLKVKLDAVKSELQLARKISVSVDSLNQLDKAYVLKRDALDQEHAKYADYLQTQHSHLKNELVALQQSRQSLLESIKTETLKKQYVNDVSLEQRYMQQHDAYQIQCYHQQCSFLDQQKNHESTLFKLLQEEDERRKKSHHDHQHMINELMATYKNKEHTLQVGLEVKHAKSNQLLEEERVAVAEQIQLLSHQAGQITVLFSDRQSQAEDQFLAQKHALQTALDELTDSFKTAETSWSEKEATFIAELDQKKIALYEEKEVLLYELSTQKKAWSQKMQAELNDIENEKKEWDAQESNRLNELKHKEVTLEQTCQSLENHIQTLKQNTIRSVESCEFFQLLSFERQQRAMYDQGVLEMSLEEKKAAQSEFLKREYDEKKEVLIKQLGELEARQKRELFLMLEDKEREFLLQKQSFEDDMKEKKQALLDECRREQKVEFDHIIAFEREKHDQIVKDLKDDILRFKQGSIDEQSSFAEIKKQYEVKLKELSAKNTRLSGDMLLFQEATQKRGESFYEKKFNTEMAAYKEKVKEDLRHYAAERASFHNQDKTHKFKIAELEYKILQLETQLNRKLVASPVVNPIQARYHQKVIRSKKEFGGA